MPTVHDVADYLLWLADQDRIGVDHLKLQKLVYYAQGFHLGNEREPLFNEGLHAWQYGPVCPRALAPIQVPPRLSDAAA